MSAKFIPLSVPSLKGNELKYVEECIKTEWVSSAGSYVDKFEKRIAEYTGSKYAVACVNGTAALHIALLLSGVESGDEVIVPTLTFIAPVNAVRYVNAEPVFMDCDDYLNIDSDKVEEFCERECRFDNGILVNKKSGRKIKAVVPVHVFGNPVDMEKLIDVTRRYNLRFIEDATESLGSKYISGRYKDKMPGTIGDFGCLSFNGNKIVTSGGGGMILTNDQSVAEKARYLTTQAKDDDLYYKHNEVGYNYRLTNVQAAIGYAQMEQIDKFVEIKRVNFGKYRESLASFKNLNLIDEPPYSKSNFWHYALDVGNRSLRDGLIQHLRKSKIGARPVWSLNHLQKPYKDCQRYRIEKAGKFADGVLNIPCSVSLSDEDIVRVGEQLWNGLKG